MPEVLLAASLSRLASRMVTLAIILFALDRFKSPALVGWVAFASLAPGLAVSPLAGALLDASARRGRLRSTWWPVRSFFSGSS